MQILEMSEINGWDAKAIDMKVVEIRRSLFSMRMQGAVASVEKPHLIKIGNKNIARLLTAKNAKGKK